VNGYLLAQEPVTMIDAGPVVATTLPAWERAVAAAGMRLRDVEQIVLTHQHWDHIGAAELMREATGAPVLAPVGVAPYASDFAAAIGQEVAFYAALMAAHGVPAGFAADALEIFDTLPCYVGRTELDAQLADGDELRAGGVRLTVLARPGHSVSDTLFADVDAGEALVGDHLLEVSVPVVMPPVELCLPAAASHRTPARRALAEPSLSEPTIAGPELGERPLPADRLLRSGLPEMLDSLRRTDELELECALAGHGGPIRDVHAAVARAVVFYRRHDQPILATLARGPATAWELVRARDAVVRDGDALYKLASTLGSLELLRSEGRVVQLDSGGDGPPRFGCSA
jgi:glyoxylase-like metal-dependent hydrolase (beta-lactamase superfamily II)